MGGMSRNRHHLKLARQRARAAKLRKLRAQYRQATSAAVKQKLEAKLVRLAPYAAAREGDSKQ